MNAVNTLVTVLATLLGAGGMAAMVRALADRKVTAASAVEKITDSSVQLIQQAVKDAEVARSDARKARDEARTARREAEAAREDADEAVATMRRWRMAILDPAAVMDPLAHVERLRKMVTGTMGRADNGIAARLTD